MSQSSPTPQEYEVKDGEVLLILSNKATNIVYANSAFVEASGYSWDELKTMVSVKMLHKDTPPHVLHDMIRVIKNKRPWNGIIKDCRKNGQTMWLRLNLSPILVENEYAGAMQVHTRPSREEIEHIAPLYKLMCEGDKRWTVHDGEVVRNDWVTRLKIRVKAFGLRMHLWLVLAMLNFAAAAGLAALGISPATSSFWAALAGVLTVTGIGSRYLFQKLVVPLRGVSRLIDQIAAGNLALQTATSRADEIGHVMRGLTQMSMNMRATVLDVRHGVNLMQRATAEIAAGNRDLSGRTENQATSVEETASSMEQMNATVKQNADAARQASEFASSARAAAEAGGHAVGEVISTMQTITQSSQKISEIVGVIDGIAFQTNILALNAAVEAARAGEQGRGFAVVAGEVRTLAQRSASSAREIRKLISDSVAQVQSGAKLVNSAGGTMENVVSQVRRVTELVSHIAHASLEQSSGIAQVNQAITHLDHMTQQNSALVEQSSASAESLRHQTAQLANAASVFKLTEKENAELFVPSLGEAEINKMLLATLGK